MYLLESTLPYLGEIGWSDGLFSSRKGCFKSLDEQNALPEFEERSGLTTTKMEPRFRHQ